MLAKDAEGEIVRNPNPLILPSSTAVVQAARQMESHRVSAVLVTEDDADVVVGIFTGRDAVARVLARGRDPVKTPLADVMTYNPVVVTPGDSAIEALRLMQSAHCRHLPIVNDGRVVGLISRGDFRSAELECLGE
jgi:CBS domain-containing protein